jgi:hypothetical protein
VRTIAWLVFAVACSSGASTPTHPTKPTPTGVPDAGVAAGTAPSDKECEQLIAHVVDLTLRERVPAPEPAPTAAEAQNIDEPLRAFATECTTLSREAYRCGIEATTVAALTACHATRSSSTSNRSVAPPGITPAAPRSP